MRRPSPHEIYRDKKGNPYQVIAIARHTQTGEELVVSQALFNDYSFICTQLSDFDPDQDRQKSHTSDDKPSSVMNRTIDEEAEELGMDPLVVAFLDASSCSDRLQILEKLRPRITDDMIDVMSMAIDTEAAGDDVFERYAKLRDTLHTRERFESTRLRGE